MNKIGFGTMMVALVFGAGLAQVGALAGDQASTASAPGQSLSTGESTGEKGWKLTHEQRLKMAKMHERMAACLRSDKPLKDCHADMVKACHEAMGKEGCHRMAEWSHDHAHHETKPGGSGTSSP